MPVQEFKKFQGSVGTKPKSIDYIYGPVGSVTSRDDIINPYDVVDINNYKKNRAGKAEYQADLAQAQFFAAQQQAVYDEWYNSPEQQAIRDREAGLNPDVIGLSGSEAANTAPVSSNPMDGVPTNGEVAANLLTSITSLVGGIASVASLPLSFKQMQGAIEAQELSNVESFQRIASGQISDRLGTALNAATAAGQVFNIDDWFADDSNFADIVSTYAPSEHPRYSAALASTRKATLAHHKNALALQKDAAKYQSDFATIASDPRYSSDQLLQIAQLKPFMAAVQTLREAQTAYETTLTEWNKKYRDGLDVDSAVEVVNSKNAFDSAYYDAMDAEKQAAYDTYIKAANAARAKMQKEIDDNLFELYKAHPNDVIGFAASYVYSGATSKKWSEHFGSLALAYGLDSTDNWLSGGNSSVADSIDPFGRSGSADYPSISNSMFR